MTKREWYAHLDCVDKHPLIILQEQVYPLTDPQLRNPDILEGCDDMTSLTYMYVDNLMHELMLISITNN